MKFLIIWSVLVIGEVTIWERFRLKKQMKFCMFSVQKGNIAMQDKIVFFLI